MYTLLNDIEGNPSERYFSQGIASFTDLQNTSQLNISRLDMNAQIASGTFSFDIVDQNGNLC